MFSERMALEATLRREKLTTEAQTYAGMRPYGQASRWREQLLSRLGDWMVARGGALQMRYRHAVEPARRSLEFAAPPGLAARGKRKPATGRS